MTEAGQHAFVALDAIGPGVGGAGREAPGDAPVRIVAVQGIDLVFILIGSNDPETMTSYITGKIPAHNTESNKADIVIFFIHFFHPAC